jgi:hypothetical protein
MRDTQISYGMSSIGSGSPESSRVLRQTAQSFLARHEKTAMREADFTWIFGPSDTADFTGEDNDLEYLTELGFNQHKPLADAPDARRSRNTPVNSARFDMGSLQMLRDTEFMAYFDHLDDQGMFIHHHIPDSTVKSLGASLLSPQSSVWRMDDDSCPSAGQAYCLPPDNSASMMVRHRRRFLSAMIGGPALGWTDAILETSDAGAALWSEYWKQVADTVDYLQPLVDSGRGHTNLDWGQLELKKKWIFGLSESPVPVGEMVVRYFIEGDASRVCEVTDSPSGVGGPEAELILDESEARGGSAVGSDASAVGKHDFGIRSDASAV